MAKYPGQSIGQYHWGRSHKYSYLLLWKVLSEPRQIKPSAFVRQRCEGLTGCQCTPSLTVEKGQSTAQQKEQLLGSSSAQQQEGRRWHPTCSHGLRAPLASHQQALLVKHMSIKNMHFFQLNLNTVNSNVCSHKRLIDQVCNKPDGFSQLFCINVPNTYLLPHFPEM